MAEWKGAIARALGFSATDSPGDEMPSGLPAPAENTEESDERPLPPHALMARDDDGEIVSDAIDLAREIDARFDSTASPIAREHDELLASARARGIIPQALSDESAAGGASSRGSSYYSSVETCPRMWYFRYVLGLVLRYEPKFRMSGTLHHRSLAHYWADRMRPWPAWHTPGVDVLKKELFRVGEGFPSLIDESLQMLEAYTTFYGVGPGARDVEIDPVSVERVYTTTIDLIDPPTHGKGRHMTDAERAVGSDTVTCRPDLLGHYRDGRYGDAWEYIDHKSESRWRRDEHSSASGGHRLYKLPEWEADGKYSISMQFSMYLHILRTIFGQEKIRGVTVERLFRDKPFQFLRHPCQTPARAYAETGRLIRYSAVEANRIKREADTGQAQPMWRTSACEGQYGPCDMRSICMQNTKEDANHVRNALYVQIGGRS